MNSENGPRSDLRANLGISDDRRLCPTSFAIRCRGVARSYAHGDVIT
ncbi:MAG: hypothetical protein ACLR4Z_19025 [Butyricicoccaceae bacterium]